MGLRTELKWLPHNTVGHTAMGLLSVIGLRRLGLWIHDVTIPRSKVGHKQAYPGENDGNR